MAGPSLGIARFRRNAALFVELGTPVSRSLSRNTKPAPVRRRGQQPNGYRPSVAHSLRTDVSGGAV